MGTENQIFIGLMSGTSLDGVDAVLVEFKSSSEFKILESEFSAYSSNLRQKLNDTAQNNALLLNNDDSPLNEALAPIYAQACEQLINKSGISKSIITGIANHGQTVKHEPLAILPYSLQLGNGQTLANLTALNVFTQFRQADLAAGGQGAPLMPAFHAAWLEHEFQNNNYVIVLNIGGIANISRLGKHVIGFDTGPGNVLMDQWIEKHTGKLYDHNGDWAQSGKVNNDLLKLLLQAPYFALAYPKSTGTDYFNLDYVYQAEPSLDKLEPADVQATLLALTVESIALEIEHLHATGVVYVCGGGARNSTLMHKLKQRLNHFSVDTSDAAGVPADWVEAVGFAWLGYCCNNNIASNMPSVTGAEEKVVLGEIFKPNL